MDVVIDGGIMTFLSDVLMNINLVVVYGSICPCWTVSIIKVAGVCGDVNIGIKTMFALVLISISMGTIL